MSKKFRQQIWNGKGVIMKSPLRKRIPRELKGEFGKYLVVFLLMVLTIGFVSGFLVADGSMLKAYDESFDKYNIENEISVLRKKFTDLSGKTLRQPVSNFTRTII